MTRPCVLVIQMLAIILSATPVWSQQVNPPNDRPTITIAGFDTERTAWMPPPGLGETLAELLTERLVASGSLRVVDRIWLGPSTDRTMLPFESLLDRATAAGVDYIVLGAVTQLSIERKSSAGGGLIPIPLAGGLFSKRKTASVLGLALRVIDVRTGEVVATSTAQSGAERRTSAGGGLLVAHLPLVAGAGSSTTGVHDRLLAETMAQAVAAAADQIVAAAPRLIRARTGAGEQVFPEPPAVVVARSEGDQQR
jgi:curli biogenesis system outer membrane secretion channel CsgG